MAQPTLSKCCVSGVIHEGTPTGKMENIGDVTTYVALPSAEFDATKAIVFLPDAFGHALVNNKLLVDSFAASGFATYFPDIFFGDPFPLERLNGNLEGFDPKPWLAKHDQAATRPVVDKFLAGLKEKGVQKFAATGYCFGARYVVDLALDGQIHAGAVAHPSLIKIPADLEALKAVGSFPLLWNTAEKDHAFGKDACEAADNVFAGEPFYKRNFYLGCEHGFAVRGDMSDPVLRHGKEDAFNETVEWFKKWL
ncbi:alpha/beta-hydrolase [Pseudohyphozyma bogoriensis]|nr:alpha/beta-hydrolase [Pseudohyphozyma bogoriensis]